MYLNKMQLWYLSGILTVFFCGIVMSHYTWHNVTESSRITTKYIFNQIFQTIYVDLSAVVTLLNLFCLAVTDMLLQLSLLFLKPLSSFMLVWMRWTLKSGGLLAIGKSCILSHLDHFYLWRLLNHVSPTQKCFPQKFLLITIENYSCTSLGFFCRPKTSVAVSSVLLGLVLAGRAAFVFPLSFLSNLTKKSQSEKISFREQVWLDFCENIIFQDLSGCWKSFHYSWF